VGSTHHNDQLHGWNSNGNFDGDIDFDLYTYEHGDEYGNGDINRNSGTDMHTGRFRKRSGYHHQR
jgi:hypothetical protein